MLKWSWLRFWEHARQEKTVRLQNTLLLGAGQQSIRNGKECRQSGCAEGAWDHQDRSLIRA